mgnify:CR=1 FL=1|jgi:hypothetical protein
MPQGTSLQAKLYRSRMANNNEEPIDEAAAPQQQQQLSAAKKKKIQDAQKKVNKILSDGLGEYLKPGNIERISIRAANRDRILKNIGELIDSLR